MTWNKGLTRVTIQILVFLIVFQATVNQVGWADTLLALYSVLIIAGTALMVMVVFSPKEIYTEKSYTDLIKALKIERGPAAKLIKRFSMIVSAIEFALFLQYDFYWMAMVWIGAEIISMVLHRRYDTILSEESAQST